MTQPDLVRTLTADSGCRWTAFLELTKPRLTLTSVLTVLWGFLMASGKSPDAGLLFHAMLAAALVGGGANALNEYLERDIDARMRRTESRPLPSGRITPARALLFGTVLSAAGTLYLAVSTNFLAGLFGATTLLGYILVYTPLKRVTPLNTFAGAVMGALPILMGWSAAGRPLNLEAGVLFLILFLWQLPHFLAIAWLYRDDYLRSGLRMFPVYDRDFGPTALRILVYATLLLSSTLLPSVLGMAGAGYAAGALAAGLGFCALAAVSFGLLRLPAKALMMGSIGHLLFLIVLMIGNRP